jgi:transcriptional antiterminator NusG
MEDHNLFILKVKKGSENDVKNFIEVHKKKYSLDEDIEDIFVVEEESVKIVNGKKKEKICNKYPGYVFLKLKTNFDNCKLCELLKTNTNIYGDSRSYNFVTRLSSGDAVKVLTKDDIVSKTNNGEIKIGDEVVIISGSLKNLKGKVFDINEKNNTLTVNVRFFLGGETAKINCCLSEVEKCKKK